MPKIREPVKPVDPETESSEEEEEGSTEESDSEPEPTQLTKKPSSSTSVTRIPVLEPAPKPPKPEPSEDEDEDEESESESESDSDGPNPKVTTVATKSLNDVLKSSAVPVRSKPAAVPVTPSKSAAGKRLAEENGTDAKDAKKSKKKADPETSVKKPIEDSKKPPFHRIWSEDDEIVLLKGMIEYSKKKGDPIIDGGAFHDFIHTRLDVVDLSRTQLLTKIRRMKKKYLNNLSKEKEGEELILPKPHEQNAYELSKILWGNENANVKENGGEKLIGSPKTNSVVKRASGKKAKKDIPVLENEDANEVKILAEDVRKKLLGVAPIIGNADDRILLMGEQMYEKGILGEEWDKLKMEEYEVYMKTLDVKSRRLKLVMDNLKSRGD